MLDPSHPRLSMRSRRPPAIAAVALLRAFLLMLGLVTVLQARAGPVEIGQPAPVLKGTLVSGDHFDLADYRGKVVLVNFYSSFCKSCAYEIGNLETFRDDHRDEGFEILMLGVDRLQDKSRVARMLGTYNLQGAMVDELEECGFERRYPTPTSFIIDRDGVVRDKASGSKTLPRLRELVSPHLGKR
jgi:cytochrome c biogenesis protein CcmG/thiol:disulfide interchange protein DsbE